MFQTLSRTYLDSTLINKQVDYYICVYYHQNVTLHKNGFNKFSLFDDDKPNDHNDMKGKHKSVPNQSTQRKEIFEEINSSQVKPI